MPTVSVIITTYNHAHYLLESIESVFAQTFKDYEIIVVDDGSTDNTKDVLSALIAAQRIRYAYQVNKGKSVARNYGIELAQGKYVAFHDADDLYDPTKLEKQVAYFKTHPEVALVHSGYSKFDDDGNDLGYRDTSKKSGWIYPEILVDWSVLMGVPCVMVRTAVFAELGGFDPAMIRAQDLDMWRRIARHYPFGVVPEPLSYVRVYPENWSSDKVTLAAPYFEMYLEKAFHDDPGLGKRFERVAYAKLYANIGHNYLARGDQAVMGLVRKYSLKALKSWPFQWSAYLGYFGSFVSIRMRDRLLTLWRKFRYDH